MSYSALPTSIDHSPPQPPPLGARYPGLPWSASTSSSSISSLAQSPTQAFASRLKTLATVRTLAYAVGAGFVLVLLMATQGGSGLAGAGARGARSEWRLGSFAGFYSEEWEPSRAGREEADNSKLLEPTWAKGDDGLEYPPDVYPADLNPFQRANAALVVLVRNSEREQIMSSMRSLETKFNNKYGYPWVMMNEEPFTDEFKKDVKRMTRHEVIFHQIPYEHWSYPPDIDQERAAAARAKMASEGVIYGGLESYRHMCRFNSGFFYKQSVLDRFDWYWRVEPGVQYHCDIDYDPFLFMQRNNKVYGWTMALYEYRRTVESLWQDTRDFVKLHPESIHPDNALKGFMIDDESKDLQDGDWNNCHFWSNFEIASLKFWRSPAYEDYFNHLDKTGNFFYERTGDAPVHSIAASLFLPASALHHFADISYEHNPYQTCPTDVAKYHDTGKCQCDPKKNFDYDGYSCMRQWERVASRLGNKQ